MMYTDLFGEINKELNWIEFVNMAKDLPKLSTDVCCLSQNLFWYSFGFIPLLNHETVKDKISYLAWEFRQ